MRLNRRSVVLGLVSLSACGGEGSNLQPSPPPPPPPPVPPPPPPPPPPPGGSVRVDISFATGILGWETSYADYTTGQEPTIGFLSGFEHLPPPLDNRLGLFLSSMNRSDDVFMYASRPVTGLAGNTLYQVEVEISLASNVPPGCVGVGGAPGEAVAIKAGAFGQAPAHVERPGSGGGSYVTTNFDHGAQSNPGADMAVIGNLAFGGGTCNQGIYQLRTLSTGGNGVRVRSDPLGRLWLILGSDSGFEGFTKFYFLEGSATFTPV